jgi:hypothetical protein
VTGHVLAQYLRHGCFSRRAAGARWPHLATARLTEAERPMAEKRTISLVLADVDGMLVTEEKILTERAQ